MASTGKLFCDKERERERDREREGGRGRERELLKIFFAEWKKAIVETILWPDFYQNKSKRKKNRWCKQNWKNLS